MFVHHVHVYVPFSAMSSSKRKLVVEKSTSDDKSKVSVFDRLGPGVSSRSELEVSCFNLSMLPAIFRG